MSHYVPCIVWNIIVDSQTWDFLIVCVIAHCERETLLSISSTDNLGCESIYGQYTVISPAGVYWRQPQSFFSINQQTLRADLVYLAAGHK